MNKREEILRGLSQLDELCPFNEGDCPPDNSECVDCIFKLSTAKIILTYLHSQDVAIIRHFKAGDDLTGASLVWVEPLIKE